MKQLSGCKKRLVIVGFVVTFVLVSSSSSNADFIFGTSSDIGPTINNSGVAIAPGISSDGLELYFMSLRPGGYGGADIWVTTRSSKDDPWGEPKNLGSKVNSPNAEFDPSISGDGLTLYFSDGLWDGYNPRPGGFGEGDLWMTTRPSPDDDWGPPENLGSIVNSSATEGGPGISSDGLSLYFESNRAGGPGTWNLWVTTRVCVSDPWKDPENLGSVVNSSAFDAHPDISADGLALFFQSTRSGSWNTWVTIRANISEVFGSPVNIGQVIYDGVNGFPSISSDGRMLYFTPNKFEIWQVPIIPIIDLSGDGIVDSTDMCVMVDYWGTDEPLCDIGPMPWGDGIADVQDLIVLSEHLFEEVIDPTLIAHWPLDETEGMYAADSVGDNDAIVLGGIEWQPAGGQIDGALQLDGISGYAIAGAVLSPVDGPFSIITWIKSDTSGRIVISQQFASNWLATDAEGNLMTELKSSDQLAEPLLSKKVITDGQWHRIGFVWDGSHRILYVDGIAVAEDTQPDLEGSENGLNIGAGKMTQPGTYFSGLIDDIRIYNRVVSP